jgi:phosphoribosylformylglycinamidine synthase
VSPWASKATDIAHNCGIGVRRVERAVEYRVQLKGGLLGGKAALTGRSARPWPRCCTTA